MYIIRKQVKIWEVMVSLVLATLMETQIIQNVSVSFNVFAGFNLKAIRV